MELNTVSVSNERVTWIDVFKGIGIILVVIGHSSIPQKLSWWIWSFHMPMFFFISGFLFNPIKNPSFSIFLSKRIKMLIMPYFIYSIFIMICFLYISIISDLKLEAFTLPGFLKVFLYGWSGLALWFIPVLFFTEIVFYCLSKIIDSNLIFTILIIFFSVATYFISKHEIKLAYKLEVVPGALVFYGIGSLLYSNIINFIKIKKQQMLLLVAIIFFVINVIFCFMNNLKLDMCYNKMGNFFYTYTSAVSGIFSVLLLSYFLSRRLGSNNSLVSSLIFLGRNSLIIVLLHQLIKIWLNILVTSLSLNGIISTGFKHIFFWIIMVFTIKFINRYLYFTLGRTVSSVLLK